MPIDRILQHAQWPFRVNRLFHGTCVSRSRLVFSLLTRMTTASRCEPSASRSYSLFQLPETCSDIAHSVTGWAGRLSAHTGTQLQSNMWECFITLEINTQQIRS